MTQFKLVNYIIGDGEMQEKAAIRQLFCKWLAASVCRGRHVQAPTTKTNTGATNNEPLILFKVFYARFEDRLEFVASDVLEDVFGAEAFGVRHLAQDTAIGLVMPSTARTDWFGLYSLS